MNDAEKKQMIERKQAALRAIGQVALSMLLPVCTREDGSLLAHIYVDAEAQSDAFPVSADGEALDDRDLLVREEVADQFISQAKEAFDRIHRARSGPATPREMH